MKKLLLLSTALFLHLALNESPARALSIAPMGGLNFTAEFSTPPSLNTQSGADPGTTFGVLTQIPLHAALSLETGLLYSTEKPNSYFITDSALRIIYTKKYLKIPLTAQLLLFDFFTLGGGFYYAAALGDLSIEDKLVQGRDDKSTASYDAYKMNPANAGALLSLGIQYPLAPQARLLVRGTFEMGLMNLSTSAETTTHSFGFGALAGVSFEL